MFFNKNDRSLGYLTAQSFYYSSPQVELFDLFFGRFNTISSIMKIINILVYNALFLIASKLYNLCYRLQMTKRIKKKVSK